MLADANIRQQANIADCIMLESESSQWKVKKSAPLFQG